MVSRYVPFLIMFVKFSGSNCILPFHQSVACGSNFRRGVRPHGTVNFILRGGVEVECPNPNSSPPYDLKDFKEVVEQHTRLVERFDDLEDQHRMFYDLTQPGAWSAFEASYERCLCTVKDGMDKFVNTVSKCKIKMKVLNGSETEILDKLIWLQHQR